MFDPTDTRPDDSQATRDSGRSAPAPGGEALMDDEGTPDLDSRVLCPDGSCIGVVGPDGCCKVCGARSVTPAPVAEPATGTAGRPPEDASADEQDDEAAPDLGDRRLCSDGACIGVIGPDGHCKACGKPYTGEPEL